MAKLVTTIVIVLVLFRSAATKTTTGAQLKLEIANARIPSPRGFMAAVYDGDDSVYIMGGWNQDQQNQILKYSLGTDTMEIIGTGPAISSGNLFLSSDRDKLIYLGGYPRSASVHHFSLSTNLSNVAGQQLPSDVYFCSSAWDNRRGLVYIFGGIGGVAGYYLDEVVRYETETGRADIVAHLPTAYASSASVWAAQHEVAYVFGGSGSGNPSKNILRFDPATQTVETLTTKLPHSVFDGVAVYDEVNDRIYIASGEHLMRFDPVDESVLVLTESVAGWPEYQGSGINGVFVAKLGIMYLFGGKVQFKGERSESYTDKIMYVNLGHDERTNTQASGFDLLSTFDWLMNYIFYS